MQVNLSDPDLVDDLIAWLERVGCSVEVVADGTLEVSLAKPIHPVDAAETQLDLFLRVWEVTHDDPVQARRIA